MPDYSKCVIYKIVCKNKNIKDCYIGSTCNYINRKSQHKNCCNNVKSKLYNIKVYKFIRDNEGWDNWDFVIIEKYPCNDKVEKLIRERYWVELMGTLNNNIPNRAEKEYRDNNKEYHKEYHKEYRDNNKDKIAEYQKEYNKEYRDNNKDKIAEYQKEYRKNKKPYTCITCNTTMRSDSKTYHNKSKKHLRNLEKST